MLIRDALLWWRARALWEARKLGFVSEAVAIAARYARCQQDWQPHLQKSRAVIAQSLQRCRQHRTALVLGAGQCLDIPLDMLATRFEKVLLVDVVRLPSVRQLLKRYANVEFVLCDVSECLHSVARDPRAQAMARMQQHQPTAFLDRDDIDWVGSINLLSQLPLLPMRYLHKKEDASSEREVNAVGLALMQNHLHYLQKFKACRVLIYDVEQWLETSSGEREELVRLDDYLQLPEGTVEDWLWHLAPLGEMKHYAAFHRVQARCW